jgi:ATP-binding cassette, subfamily B, bacterial
MFKAVQFTLRKVWESSKSLSAGYLILSVVYSLMSFGTTLILKEIIDTVNGGNTLLHFTLIGILVFKVAFDIIAGIIGAGSDYLMPLLKKHISMHFLEEMINRTASLDIPSFEDPKTVSVIGRAYSRIHFQFEYYYRDIITLLTTLLEISLALVIFVIASPLGALLLVLANLTATVVKARLGGANFNIYKANYETRLKFGYATDMLNQRETLLELKLYQNFKYLKHKILNIYNTFISKEIAIQKRNQILGSLIGLLPIAASFIFTLIMAGQLQAGEITVGTFVFLFTNMLIFAGSLGRLSSTFVNVAGEANSIKDIIEFYELKPKIAYRKVRNKQDKEYWLSRLSKPEITFDHVTFKYPNALINAVDNVSLTVPYSQNLALIGENGAGKTTLIKLLLRVYDPDRGKICINGIDIKEIPIEAMYSIFGTLFQNFGRFNLTIRENLEIAANRKLSDEEMISYLKWANAWHFIENTKGKLDQQLGPEYKDGIDLSGGQWQSLAIARAYAKKAPVVILDEPTSAIDAKSEMEIFDRLNKKMRSETLIFISHRFSTIKDASRIVVLSKGKLIEDGTHAQLMQRQGKYAQLYTIQAERFMRNP